MPKAKRGSLGVASWRTRRRRPRRRARARANSCASRRPAAPWSRTSCRPRSRPPSSTAVSHITWRVRRSATGLWGSKTWTCSVIQAAGCMAVQEEVAMQYIRARFGRRTRTSLLQSAHHHRLRQPPPDRLRGTRQYPLAHRVRSVRTSLQGLRPTVRNLPQQRARFGHLLDGYCCASIREIVASGSMRELAGAWVFGRNLGTPPLGNCLALPGRSDRQ